MKFEVSNNNICPTDKTNTYGLTYPIPIEIIENKRNNPYRYIVRCLHKYRGKHIEGNPGRTQQEAINSMLMWLENSVDPDSNSSDWTI